MSVLVEGMDMPTGCISCDFCNPFVEEPYCRRLMKRVPKVTRLDNCPFIEVHEPHGRLGDLDALHNAIAANIIGSRCGEETSVEIAINEAVADDLMIIDAQQTIIPASEEAE